MPSEWQKNVDVRAEKYLSEADAVSLLQDRVSTCHIFLARDKRTVTYHTSFVLLCISNCPLHREMFLDLLMIMSMGWDYVSEFRPPTGLLFIPWWYMSTENHGWMILTWENSWFVHQNASGKTNSSHLVTKLGKLVKEMMHVAYEIFLSYFDGFF
jgi:hypothetical protein